MRNFNLIDMKKILILPLLFNFTYASEDIKKEIDELKEQAQKILNRVSYLEQKLEVKVDEKEVKKVKTKPKEETYKQKGFLELKNAKTTLTVGGRIMLEGVFNSTSSGVNSGNDLTLNGSAIPLKRDGEKNQFNVNARDSRFWFKTKTPTDYGLLYSLIETDFAGDIGGERTVNPNKVRLRHAYVELGGLAIGQTFSTFMGVGNSDVIEDPIDIVHVRQPVIRWTKDLNSAKFQLALESPESTLNDKNAKRIAPDDDRLPDIVAKYEKNGEWGRASLSAMLRQIRSDGSVKNGVSDEKIGGAVHLAGRIKTIGHDDLRFGFTYGNALGRYISWNSFNSGNIDENGKISLNKMYGGHIAYQHWWSNKLRSSALYSRIESENDLSIVSTNVNKILESTHINLFWTPIENTQLGIEFVYATRELESGENGDLARLYFNARYDF